MARLTAGSSGARRREGEEPKLVACSANPFELPSAQVTYAEHLSVRSRLPADDVTTISSITSLADAVAS